VSHLQRIWFFRAWGGQDFTVSERVEIGKAVEAKLNETERRGRPKQDNEDQGELVEDEIPANWPEFESGETREIAAKKAGFDSEQTYRRAKTVVENAEPELVAAMDQGTIAPSMP
jgi:ParB family chromosome partitioning protein